MTSTAAVVASVVVSIVPPPSSGASVGSYTFVDHAASRSAASRIPIGAVRIFGIIGDGGVFVSEIVIRRCRFVGLEQLRCDRLVAGIVGRRSRRLDDLVRIGLRPALPLPRAPLVHSSTPRRH